MISSALSAVDTATWSDYDGDDVYGDFTMTTSSPYVADDSASYEPGIALVDPFTGTGQSNTKYYHTDHLGTTRTMSVAAGFDGGTRVYTAFGEVLAGPTDRFGYVGAHGSQAHDGVPFLHVGAQYYDPSSGRFLQRDPIGIGDDENVYAYGSSLPNLLIDPDGLTADNPGGAGGHFPKGVREVIETCNGMKDARQLAAIAAREAAKKASKAKEIMRNNKDFKRWFHRTYKPKTKIPGKNQRNPDTFWEDVYDAYEDWVSQGRPVPK